MICKELRALLEARCPHRANFFTASRGVGVRGIPLLDQLSKLGNPLIYEREPAPAARF